YEGSSIALLSNVACVKYLLMILGMKCRGRRIYGKKFFFFRAEDGIRDRNVTGVQTCALPISWVNVFPYMVVARKEIAKIQDLKGKTGQVGATFGSAPDVALRFGLSKLGLDPEKDVKLVQMPRPDWANVIAQIEKGDVQFSVLPP